MAEIQIRFRDGATLQRTLETRRITLGRSAGNDLHFPGDKTLSREHLALEPEQGAWWACDLGSRNGTRLNGRALDGRARLGAGDVIEAGELTIYFLDTPAVEERTVVFTAPKSVSQAVEASEQLRLDEAIGDSTRIEKAFLLSSTEAATARLQTLFEAGRELAGRRPLDELFPLILRLAARAAGAERGVVMTLEGGELVTRAAMGADFRISTAVRDRVMGGRESLLIHDVASDEGLKASATLIMQRVRTLLAAPLQTDEKVIGLVYLDSIAGRPFTAEDLTLLTVLANIAAIRIEHARLIELEQAERVIQAELRQAAEIQRGLLPKSDPALAGFEIAGQSEPCRTVNGDYFDYLPMPGQRLAVVVGDVAGKGISAALLAAAIQARLHTISEEEMPVEQMVARLNRGMNRNMPGGRFVTMVVAVLDGERGSIRYTNAGHNRPLLVRASGATEELSEGGLLLGILPNAEYVGADIRMESGDVLVFFSDGVTEAANEADEDFGEARLMEVVREHQDRPAAAIGAAIRDAVTRHLDGQPSLDDVTVVVVKRG
ncbi:MAG: SpoIIE family protein phosphatase [Bryobacteraceae bacterium]|nr:SpoIIE family protein phosphatase [Bryobacteraceae bacterium]